MRMALDLPLGQGTLGVAIDAHRAMTRAQVAQGDVGADRLGQQQAFALAVFGDQGDARAYGGLGRVDADGLRRLAQRDAAAVGTGSAP